MDFAAAEGAGGGGRVGPGRLRLGKEGGSGLLGHGAGGAGGVVGEAEVFVDLEEGLLLPEFAGEAGLIGVAAEEAEGGAAGFFVVDGGGELAEGVPGGVVVGEEEGVADVGEDFVEAVFAEEGSGFGGGG